MTPSSLCPHKYNMKDLIFVMIIKLLFLTLSLQVSHAWVLWEHADMVSYFLSFVLFWDFFFFSLRIFQMYFLCSYYKKIKSKQYTLGTWMKNEDTWFSSLGNEFMKNWTCVKALMCCLTSDNSNHGIWITRRAQVKKEWKWKISYYFTIYTPLLPQSGWLAMIRQLP